MNPNHFTEVLLPMFAALQPFLRERMGEWREYEHAYQDDCEGIVLFMWRDDAPTINMFTPLSCYDVRRLRDDAVRLPLTIDDSSEEARGRSLWGMCVGDKRLWKVGERHYLAVNMTMRDYYEAEGATPTHAILLALCAQEGITLDK